MDKRLLNLREEKIGQKRMTNDGLWEMECVEYKGCYDITVRIQVEIDGVIYNVDRKSRWDNFDKGQILKFNEFEINGITYKKCAICNEILEIDKFNKIKNRKNKYKKVCYECEKKRGKKYYSEHKEHYKQYRNENPDKIFNNQNKRRGREENQGNGISSEQWYEMMIFFDFRCAYSGEYLGNEKNKSIRSIDHIIPLNKGGEHEVWNCVPMYINYNKSKQTKDMLEWYMEQPFFSEERLQKIYEWQDYAKNKWNNNEIA